VPIEEDGTKVVNAVRRPKRRYAVHSCICVRVCSVPVGGGASPANIVNVNTATDAGNKF
jgi:hypothetical protein